MLWHIVVAQVAVHTVVVALFVVYVVGVVCALRACKESDIASKD